RFTAASGTATTTTVSSSGRTCTVSTVMGYYDGNTVTGMWNYAQHFAMSDNSWSDAFGPSTPGAIEVVSGNTFGAICGPTSSTINAAPCTAAPGSATATPGQPAA